MISIHNVTYDSEIILRIKKLWWQVQWLFWSALFQMCLNCLNWQPKFVFMAGFIIISKLPLCLFYLFGWSLRLLVHFEVSDGNQCISLNVLYLSCTQTNLHLCMLFTIFNPCLDWQPALCLTANCKEFPLKYRFQLKCTLLHWHQLVNFCLEKNQLIF